MRVVQTGHARRPQPAVGVIGVVIGLVTCLSVMLLVVVLMILLILLIVKIISPSGPPVTALRRVLS